MIIKIAVITVLNKIIQRSLLVIKETEHENNTS